MVQEYTENDALKETYLQAAADTGIWHYNSTLPRHHLSCPTCNLSNLFMFSNSFAQA